LDGGTAPRKLSAYTWQQKHRIKTDEIHALSEIRTHDFSVRAAEDIYALDSAAIVISQTGNNPSKSGVCFFGITLPV
jgi:hypothetical protein